MMSRQGRATAAENPRLAKASALEPLGQTVDIGRLLDEGPWSPFQKLVLLLVSFTIVLDGLDTQTISLAIPTISQEWGIGRAPFGVVLSLGFVTTAIGTIWGGLFGDRFGRRGALLGSVVIFGAGTLAAAFTNDVIMLGVTRMVASVGIGAAMPSATAMVVEYTPRRHRSLGVGIAMGCVPVGGFIGGMLAAYILPHGSWRDLFLVCGIVPLAGAVLLAFVLPESIRFLLGRPGSGLRVAALLGRLGRPASSQDRFVDAAEDHSAASIGQLFAPTYRRDTLILSAAFFLIICANIFVVSWMPSLLADLGYPPTVTSTGVAAWTIGGLFGAICGGAMLARIGSRVGLSLMFGGAVLVTLLMCLLPLGPNGIGASTLVCLVLIGGFFIPGSQVLLFALAGQIYPTTVRSTGVGFTVAVGRVGAMLSGLAGPLILPTGSLGFFAVVAVAMLACGLLLRFIRSEVPPRLRSDPTSR